MTRGKTYIKETGIIKDAQAYGWEILDSIVPCGVNEVTPEQIQQIINEISNNIGNGDCMSNCCCCNGGGNEIDDILDPSVDVPDFPIFDEGELQGDDDWLLWKCQAADWTVSKMIQTAAIGETTTLESLPILEQYEDALERSMAGLFSVAPKLASYMLSAYYMSVAIISIIYTALATEVASNIGVWFEVHREELKNAIFCGETPAIQKENVKAILRASTQPVINRYISQMYSDIQAWGWMWIPPEERPLLGDYAGIVAGSDMCACASGGGGGFDLPVGWFAVPLEVDFFGLVNDGTFASVSNQWLTGGGDNDGADIDVLPPRYTDLSPVANNDIGGIIIDIGLQTIAGTVGNGAGKQNVLSPDSFSDLEFFPVVEGEVFAGVRGDIPELQTWLTATSPDYEDNDTTLHDGDYKIRWIYFGGDGTTTFTSEVFA
ncbi:MAG: hypothetical protein KAJ39_09540, partial [Gammaproteobacteria bacterium]|nr:hypothetical protein [Gammaproteobacteria bacterium]